MRRPTWKNIWRIKPCERKPIWKAAAGGPFLKFGVIFRIPWECCSWCRQVRGIPLEVEWYSPLIQWSGCMKSGFYIRIEDVALVTENEWKKSKQFCSSTLEEGRSHYQKEKGIIEFRSAIDISSIKKLIKSSALFQKLLWKIGLMLTRYSLMVP